MSLEAGEVIEPDQEPEYYPLLTITSKAKSKPKPKPKPSPLVEQSRLDRARNIGIIASHTLRNSQVPDIPIEKLQLRNRYWIVVRGARCAHSGLSESWACAKLHVDFSVSSESSRILPSPIFEAFPSLSEARVFWEEVFPGVTLDHLCSACNPLEYLSTQ